MGVTFSVPGAETEVGKTSSKSQTHTHDPISSEEKENMLQQSNCHDDNSSELSTDSKSLLNPSEMAITDSGKVKIACSECPPNIPKRMSIEVLSSNNNETGESTDVPDEEAVQEKKPEDATSSSTGTRGMSPLQISTTSLSEVLSSNNNDPGESTDVIAEEAVQEKKPEDTISSSTGTRDMSPLRISGPSGQSDDDDDDEEEVETLEELRQRNVEKMAAFINSLRNPEWEQQFADANKERARVVKKARKTRKAIDASVRFRVPIPVEIRKSSRLQKKKPEYREGDLDNIEENVRRTYLKRPNDMLDDYYVEDLEDVVYKPKRKSSRKKIPGKDEARVIIKVEDVTQAMLNNISLRVKNKVYSQLGTTCHQCRQKTLDQKTCCRNPDCTGIQGMFCGVCIKNRYGEDCAEALLNPNWTCPVCRGKCNCSICRNRQGKRPTGILTPLALQSGYKCVDDFLKNLKREGDKPEEDHIWALARNPEAVLGFSAGGRKVHLANNKVQSMLCGLCVRSDCDNPEKLLGFSEDGTTAIMGSHKHEPLFALKD